ncbi:protein of unknown function [Tranquillimonas rosea]|uniref:YjiS-like domain-containing protein n=1 Tax=Tranquillimonas rosea TaxID=641238 RepID=A0A1H9UZD7_9RHOB|nr:DUF1127 domain-containing protein [Tranquillimonas rosea]SES14772.1 protein of unknown function [Tranquillimonas rosea]
MAYADPQTRRYDATLTGSAGGIMDNLQERWTRWRLYRRTLTELQSLTTRELADLGIGRSQVRGIALEAAYGRT